MLYSAGETTLESDYVILQPQQSGMGQIVTDINKRRIIWLLVDGSVYVV